MEWLSTRYSSSIRKKAKEKINALKMVEQEIPTVFIVHNLKEDSIVYMSQRGLAILNVTLHEVQISHNEYHQRFFNLEDAAHYAPKIFSLIEQNRPEEVVTYFQQVRRSKADDWTWYLSATKILMQDEDGKPLLGITMATPIESQHHITTKVERLLQENTFLRKNNHIFAGLTKREKEILQYMALGLSASEIAKKLHISEATASTHRRNIRIKIKAQNSYDVTRFAQAFNLI